MFSKAASQSERGAVNAADVHNRRPTHAETRVKCHSANFISAADQGKRRECRTRSHMEMLPFNNPD